MAVTAAGGGGLLRGEGGGGGLLPGLGGELSVAKGVDSGVTAGVGNAVSNGVGTGVAAGAMGAGPGAGAGATEGGMARVAHCVTVAGATPVKQTEVVQFLCTPSTAYLAIACLVTTHL